MNIHLRVKRKLRWNKSDEGYTETHCGRFDIAPLYMGTTRAQAYQLIDSGPFGEDYKTTMHDTQKLAKEHAQEIIDAEASRK